ncbi:MAG TPA: MarR family winged helix-turn-helix transcriptional regulator [Alphaproteobacteria bacterium]|nr:MarR family winged helix-turn-helix transcriptional regulator [Alphaproteobacteria bacterium]
MKTSVARKPESAPPQDRNGGEYRVENHVGHLLRRAHQRHTAIFQQEFSELQLTPTQFAALAKIRDEGSVSQNLLGRLTAMDPATIQGVIQRLEARKLIERQPDPVDRRCTLLRLTAAGQAILADGIARTREVSDATLSPLTPAERQAFFALLRKLT